MSSATAANMWQGVPGGELASCQCRWPSHTHAVGHGEWLQLGSLQKGHHCNLPDRIQASLLTEWQAGRRREDRLESWAKGQRLVIMSRPRLEWLGPTKVSSWTHEAHPHTLFLFPLDSPIAALRALALFKMFFFLFPLSALCYFRPVCRSVLGMSESQTLLLGKLLMSA